MPEENLDVQPGSSPGETSNGDNGKSPSLADIVAQTAKASLATGSEGLEGGGLPPRTEGAEDGVAVEAQKEGAVQELDNTAADGSGEGQEAVEEGEGEAAPEGDAEETDDGEAENADAPKDDKKVVPDDKLPFGKHPRFQQALKEAKDAKELVASMEPMAKAQEATYQFCLAHNISPAQFNEGLELMAKLNTDPAAAYGQLKELMTVLAPYGADTVTSPDLLKDMEEGKLTPERAQEIEKYRAGQRAGAVKTQLTAKQQAAQAQQDRVTELRKWERALASKDLSFKKKASPQDVDGLYELTIKNALQLASMQPPRTNAEAVEQCEQAYKDARRFMDSRQPRPKLTKKTPTSKQSSPGASRAEPKTLMDVVSGVANGTYKPRF